MLRQRIITALIMVGSFLAALLFLPVSWLAVVLAVLIGMGAWEWSRLAGWKSIIVRVIYTVLIVASAAALEYHLHLTGAPTRTAVQPFLGTACLWWSIALLWIKGYPASAVIWRNVAMRSLMGVFVLVPAWLAAIYLLSYPRGGLILLALVAIVVVADVGAYFSGRALGKHKLAVHVSPKKTWEGFWGGVAACTLLAVVMWASLPTGQAAHVSLLAVLAVTLSTSLASVVGDLTVSMVKRESGFKDSGNILPGHGGILDRLDSLCAAAPVFALGLLLAGWQ